VDDILLADLATILFAAVTLAPWLIERSRQIFHPMKLWGALQVALVVPAAFLVARHPEYLHQDVVAACENGVPIALANALAVYAFCNASVYLAYYLVVGKAPRASILFKGKPSLGRIDSLFVVVVLLAMGLAGFIVKLSLAGGLSFLLENVSRRVELQRGLGPLNIIVDTSFLIALLISIRRFSIRGASIDLIVLILVFVLAAGTSTLFGGRKITLQLIMAGLIIYSAYRPTVLLFNIRTLLVLCGVYLSTIVYFFTVLFYRNANDIGAVADILPEIIDMAMGSFADVLMSMSYLDVYIFIVAHFDASNFYYGSTFQDVITAFLPSALVSDKPPVDDGFYVRYATLGIRVEPGTPANLLTGYGSWPPETMGAAYMNGGLWAVPISGFIQGFVLARGFLYASIRSNSLVALVILVNLFLNFEVSNLRIVSLITTIVAAIVVIGLIRFLSSIVQLPHSKFA